MSKVEHTGKEWSSSFLTGRETRKLFRWVEKASGAKIAAVGSFVGRLLDIVSGEEVGILRCGWLDNGDIEVIFPNMGVGRYVIAIDYTSQAGEVSRFLDGYAGYLEPRYIIEHQEQGEDIIITVCGSGDGREVMALAGDMVKYSAEEAIEAAKSAKNAQNEVENLLKQAIAFKESFDKALQESLTVSNNYLYVGGVNTGNYLKGDKGITPHIGADGYWYEGENRLGDRPAFGKDGITPHITADGYWALGNKVTTVRAIGRDGLDGSAVRMILVDSYEEIPQSGETCNGGFRYLVKNVGWTVVGDPDVTGSGEWEAWEIPARVLPSKFTHLRVPGVLNDNSVPVYLMVRTTDDKVLGVSQNAVTWAVGDVVTWEFSEPVRVPHNATVQIFLRKSPEYVSGSVPFEDVLLKSLLGVGTCRLRYRDVWYEERMPYFRAFGDGAAESYDHYAWVEYEGDAGWVRVDRNNEIATARVYGVMKYGTDVLVDDGAPVGRNGEGQAYINYASKDTPGVGKIGEEYPVKGEAGVYIRFDENKNYVIPKAGINTYGVVKTSYTLTVTEGGLVGTNLDGNLMVRPASTTWYGTVILGEQYAHDNPEPFMCHVGSTAGNDPRMAIAEVYGGAIQARSGEAWQGRMSWLDEQMNEHSTYFGEKSKYLGLLHTDQFTQSSGHGLELLEATNTRLAGVYIANSMSDTRPAAVLTGGVVVNYLSEHYYGKSQVYTREETETQIGKKLNNYASIQWVQDNYMTRTSIMAELKKKLNCQPGVAENIVFISASDFAKLPTIDPLTAYEIYAG